jgi:hypothetical protein
MWRRVSLINTDVSEERIDSIISTERISELGTTLAVTSNWRMQMMEAIGSFETSGLRTATRRHIPEDSIFLTVYYIQNKYIYVSKKATCILLLSI